MAAHVFVSHATADDPFVTRLRHVLAERDLSVWVDSRDLRAGARLAPEIEAAIRSARLFVVVLSPATRASTWVPAEIRIAEQVRRERADYAIVPLFTAGVRPNEHVDWFEDELLGVVVPDGPGGLDDALPALLAALGARLPDDPVPPRRVDADADAELVVRIESVSRASADVTQRPHAEVCVGRPDLDEWTATFTLTAPLPMLPREEIDWYLHQYARWPSEIFEGRARRVEDALPRIGESLYATLTRDANAARIISAWRNSDAARRTMSIAIDPSTLVDVSARTAAAELIALPWELLHDGRRYLMQGGRAAGVRRAWPPRGGAPRDAGALRVLLVSPRPEDDRSAYIDHRSSALPVVEALSTLGARAELTLLRPATMPALEHALEADGPFDVVHIDGHGVFDEGTGRGVVLFEDPRDTRLVAQRRSAAIDALQLAARIADFGVRLVVLDACRTAHASVDPTSSVAGSLVEGGVEAVVGNLHPVLVESARRFVTALYGALVDGKTIGAAVLAGRRALAADPARGRQFDSELSLADWFVPALFQSGVDRPLVNSVPEAPTRSLLEERRVRRRGTLPEAPAHGFLGRARALLRAERILEVDGYCVVVGEAGSGKTTFAAELGRWLVDAGRFAAVAFVALDATKGVRATLFALGAQLVAGFLERAAGDDAAARALIERALRDAPTLLVFDNVESVLEVQEDREAVIDLARSLRGIGDTRILFTSRERLPRPFDGASIELGRLERSDAIALVGRILARRGQRPPPEDPGSTEDLEALVDAAQGHARTLVLLSEEVGQRGVRGTQAHLGKILADLEARYPGDRERSLFASVALSRARLGEDVRRRLPRLGVFRGSGQLGVIGMVVGLATDEEQDAFGRALVDVGLAEAVWYRYVRFHPGLCPMMAAELGGEDRADAERAWETSTLRFARQLAHEAEGEDPDVAERLTRLDLANLLPALERFATHGGAPEVTEAGLILERLIRPLAFGRALDRVNAVVEPARERLGAWSEIRASAEDHRIDRLAASGDLMGAEMAARTLVGIAATAKIPNATYWFATAVFRLGWVLKERARFGEALEALLGAIDMLRTLAGDDDAADLLARAHTDAGGCFLALGHVDPAAEHFREARALSHTLGDLKGEAIAELNMGVVLSDNQPANAIPILQSAIDKVRRSGDRGLLSRGLQALAKALRLLGDPRASDAVEEALQIAIADGDVDSETSLLDELARIATAEARIDDAVALFERAAGAAGRAGHHADEGRFRNNAGSALLDLGRYAEARDQLRRAALLKAEVGPGASPWTTWYLLSRAEQALGDEDARRAAYQRSVDSFLAFRRSGGGNRTYSGWMCADVLDTVARGEPLAERTTNNLHRTDLSATGLALTAALHRILAGDRDPSLKDHPDLDFFAATELTLLLEALARGAT